LGKKSDPNVGSSFYVLASALVKSALFARGSLKGGDDGMNGGLP
jgi:hypothetical protein